MENKKSRPGVLLAEDVLTDSSHATLQKLWSKGSKQREPSVSIMSLIPSPSPPSSRKENISKHHSTVKETSPPVFVLDPLNEDVLFSIQGEEPKRLTSRSKVQSAACSSATETPLQRQLNSVRMKVGLAEAIVQNASDSAKVLMLPEDRRKHMVQLEIAKIILFVARQHNVREELQQVLGRALDESEIVTSKHRSIANPFPFLERESPPDLSLEGLKQLTHEMEQQLAEKEKTIKTKPPPPISADRVTSNLSELLWIIESLELEAPASMYADLDEPIPKLTLNSAAGIMETAQRQREAAQDTQRENISAHSTHPSATVHSDGKSFVVSGELSVMDLLRPSPELTGAQPSANVNKERNDGEETLVAFSVDTDSIGCHAPEAAGLKLLQFMYDAIDASDEPFDVGNDDEEGIFEMTGKKENETKGGKKADGKKAEECAEEKVEIIHFEIAGASQGEGMNPLLQLDARTSGAADSSSNRQRLNETTGPFINTLATTPNNNNNNNNNNNTSVEVSNDATRAAATPMPQEQYSSISSTDSDAQSSSPPKVWQRQPTPPPQVHVHPLRTDLLETLKVLYETFNYNYHFKNCKVSRKKEHVKTEEECRREMARRVAQKKSERQQRTLNQQEEDDLLFLVGDRRPSSRAKPIRSQSTISKASTDTEDKQELSSRLASEAPATEMPLSGIALLKETEVVYDETVVLAVDLNKDIQFVLKGQQKDTPRSSVDGAAPARRRSKAASITSTKGRKSAKKKGSIVGKEEENKRGNTASDAGNILLGFEQFTLYAMNRSDLPQQARVVIDATKLKNLEVETLLDYMDNKKTIGVNLAPSSGAQSILTLKPVKKGHEVAFQGALSFQEGITNIEVAPETKGTTTEKKRVSPQVRPKAAPSQGPKTTLPSTKPSPVSTATVDAKAGPAVKRDDNKDDRPLSAGIQRRVSSRQNFTPLLLGADRDFGEDLGSDLGSLAGSFSMETGATPHEGGQWGVTLIPVENELLHPTTKEVRRRRSGVEAQQPRYKEKENNATEEQQQTPALTKEGEDATEEGKRTSVTKDTAHNWADEELTGMKPVDQWGLPLENEEDEAFENNCIALSALQASGWQSNSAGRTQISDSKGIIDENTSAGSKRMSVEGEGVSSGEGNAIAATAEGGSGKSTTRPDSLTSIMSQRYPSARFREGRNTEEQLVTAFLYPQEDEGLPRTEGMITDILCIIADEEQLSPEARDSLIQYLTEEDQMNAEDVSSFLHRVCTDEEMDPELMSSLIQRITNMDQVRRESQTQKGSFSLSKKSGGELPRVGTPASWRKQLAGSHGEPRQTPPSLLSGAGSQYPLGSKTEICKVEGSSGSGKLRPPTGGSGERVTCDVGPSSSSHGGIHPHEPVDTIRQSGVDMRRVSSAHPASVEGYPHSSEVLGESEAPYYCESCTNKHHEHYYVPTDDGGDGGEDKAREEEEEEQQQQVYADMGPRTDEETQVKTERGVTPTEEKRQQIPLNLESLLAGVTKVKKEDLLPPEIPVRREVEEYSIPQETVLPAPARQYAFTEVCPGGKIAVFAPENLDATGKTSSLQKIMNTRKPSAVHVESGKRVKSFAEGIRTTMHTFARHATVHPNQLPSHHNTFGSSTQGAATRSGKSGNGMWYGTLPPLSDLYAQETAPDVEDIEAVEEEARELFMQDPARYDCVVDDLIKCAIEKVQEDEEREKEKRAFLARKLDIGKEKDGLMIISTSIKKNSVSCHNAPLTELCFHGSHSVGKGCSIADFFPGDDNNNSKNTFLRGRGSIANSSILSLLSEKRRRESVQDNLRNELDRMLDEQRRAKKIVAYILMQMRGMWRRREMEANLALRAAVDRFIYRSVLFSWHFERRRVLNLQKLLHMLDRKTGRVRGWLPFYRKDRIVEDRFIWEPAPPHLSRPLRIVHRAMCLARQQRMFPLRLVRQQARKKVVSKHILFGYRRTLIESFTTSAVRYRYGRRCRYAAPFQNPTTCFSPQVKWLDGTPRH